MILIFYLHVSGGVSEYFEFTVKLSKFSTLVEVYLSQSQYDAFQIFSPLPWSSLERFNYFMQYFHSSGISRAYSKTTNSVHDYMNHDDFSKYFLNLALDERPLTKEKLQRRLKDELYVGYGVLGDMGQAAFTQTLISGVLNLFFDNDLERVKLGLLVVKTQRCLEDAGESPFKIVSDYMIRYVLELTEIRLKNLDKSKKGFRDAVEMAKELEKFLQ